MDSSNSTGKGNQVESIWESILRQLRSVRVEDKQIGFPWCSSSFFASQDIVQPNSKCFNSFRQYIETLPKCSSLERVDRWMEKHTHFFIQEGYEEEHEDEEEEYKDGNEITEEMSKGELRDVGDMGSGAIDKDITYAYNQQHGNGRLSRPKTLWPRLSLSCHWESCDSTADTVDGLFAHLMETHFQDIGCKWYPRKCVLWCKWRGCTRDDSSTFATRYDLLVHTRIHCQNLNDVGTHLQEEPSQEPRRIRVSFNSNLSVD